MLALVGVATLGVAFEPESWFTQSYPAAAGNAAAAAAGAHGRVFANESYADWLVFEHPQLAGRIAYDSRFELLTSRQLRSVQEFRNLVAGLARDGARLPGSRPRPPGRREADRSARQDEGKRVW